MHSTDPISYAQFGENFIRQVVTAERLRAEIASLLLRPIEGRVRRLPAEMLTASYRLNLHQVSTEATSAPPEPLHFRLGLDGVLKLKLRFISIPLRFSVRVAIFVDIAVQTLPPLTIRLLPAPVSTAAVRLEINPRGIPADLLDKLNIVEPALTEEIVSEVNRRIAAPEIARAATIDVLALAQRAQLVPAPPEPAASEFIAAAAGPQPAAVLTS
jgi:hypothetical protein